MNKEYIDSKVEEFEKLFEVNLPKEKGNWLGKSQLELAQTGLKSVLSVFLHQTLQDVENHTREEAIRDVYEIAKDEVNQSSTENVPVYVRQMEAIQTYARQHDIDLTTK